MDVDFSKLIDHPVYTVMVDGTGIIVHPGVFAPDPRYSNSTGIMVRHLPEVKEKEVLDLGCGSGVISVLCAKRGAKLALASDVDPAALRNTEENIHRLHLENVMQTLRSDLFANVTGRFDYIFANLPIWDEMWNVKTTTSELAADFLKQVRTHLKPGGAAYFVWFSISPVEPVREAMQQANFAFEEFTEEALGFTWYLFILREKS